MGWEDGWGGNATSLLYYEQKYTRIIQSYVWFGFLFMQSGKGLGSGIFEYGIWVINIPVLKWKTDSLVHAFNSTPSSRSVNEN